jgi:hypothetical protein|tara:strand:+ start:12103 stop:12726 length:624 start_codon:yes stop_codon:yes gene_type:complete
MPKDNKISSPINPDLNKGDRVKLISMSDETSLSLGDGGTVTSKTKVFGIEQYGIKWDNGSLLGLLSDADHWMLEDDYNKKFNKKINESLGHREATNRLTSFKEFNMKYLFSYLLKVRESGIVNMMAATDYLWLGSDRIQHEFKYKNISDEDSFDEVIEMADMSQSEMIQGVMRVLEKEGKEMDDNTINRYLKKYSKDILLNYMYIMG